MSPAAPMQKVAFGLDHDLGLEPHCDRSNLNVGYLETNPRKRFLGTAQSVGSPSNRHRSEDFGAMKEDSDEVRDQLV